TAAVLTGEVSPSGKLPDTIAYNISDYPSAKYFGNKERNFYVEDIYVGYRWFETFAKDKVRYPFGFGLSYTTFEIEPYRTVGDGKSVTIMVNVTNTGSYKGKEVVQVYVNTPNGKIGTPSRVLCGFEKTKELEPGETQSLEIFINLADIMSFDDSGASGFAHSWINCAGNDIFYVGSDVRSATSGFSVKQPQTSLYKRCIQCMAPVLEYERIKAVEDGDDIIPVMENVPLSEVDEKRRREFKIPKAIPFTGDKGIKFTDVYKRKNNMREFLAQLSDEELMSIVRGEGMGSPRVTAGTASAFGGVTDKLVEYGIPAACCSDGPSGMRLDCGTKAFSLPNGTMIASTFNKELVSELFEFVGLEMAANNVDCLLGPGMNIHRHPLNGRNFEYFSEDPYLTGSMAAAEIRGLHKNGVTGTLKHFCGNNQETNRHFVDAVISERALREIYLKGFEIAIRDGNAHSVMTTYGSVNGLWTAGNFDLCTTILRENWNFVGIVMTDWWANISERGGKPDRNHFAAMAKAQNDIYMVCADCAEHEDTLAAELEAGTLTRAELQRNASNILSFLLRTRAMKRLIGDADEIEVINRPEEDENNDNDVTWYDLDGNLELDLSGVKSEIGKNYSFALKVGKPGWYNVEIEASSDASELAQIPVTLFLMGTASGTYTWNGTNGEAVGITKRAPIFSHFTAVRLYFAQNGLELHKIKFELDKAVDNIDIAFLQEEN
ncbi:MAG: fibronectin type III-like domain-contianing protein, partial [Ruminococcus sp.]|nr:fibronectin type III-like domain-contianing protein [Ruminococcus sp.]